MSCKRTAFLPLAGLLVLNLAACAGAPRPAASPTSTPSIMMYPSKSPTDAPPTATLPEPSTTSRVSGQPVTLTTPDGVTLAGMFFPAAGDTVVLLAHMGICDQTSWQGFAARLAELGMPAFTFDFRCMGISSCQRGSAISYFTVIDMQAAYEYLQGLGYRRVVCVGASMGANNCLNAALRHEFAALVFIAGAETYPLSNLEYPRDLVNPGMPKLFIVSDQDRYAMVVTDTPHLYDLSPEPRQIVTYPTTLHGTELFDSEFDAAFSGVLLDFLLPLNGTP